MGVDREAGSIAAGKRADLVLVDGDPTRDIAAVRNTDAVVCRGVVYDPAELFAAAGMRRRQAWVQPSAPPADIDDEAAPAAPPAEQAEQAALPRA